MIFTRLSFFSKERETKLEFGDGLLIEFFLEIMLVDFLLHTQEKLDRQLPQGPLGGPKTPLLEAVGET